MRGNQFILMDAYMDFRIDSPDEPDPKHDPARKAMGLARRLSERIDLASLTPRSDLTTTGYCLANPGVEYLVYSERSKDFSVNLEPGDYSVEWINTSNGQSTKGKDIKAGTAKNIFSSPFNGPSILYLRKR